MFASEQRAWDRLAEHLRALSTVPDSAAPSSTGLHSSSLSQHVQPQFVPFMKGLAPDFDLLGYLLEQEHELCPQSVWLADNFGQMHLTARCRRATCRVCARLDAARQAAAVQFVAKARTAVTITELMPRQTPNDFVWPEAQRVTTEVLRHLRRKAGPTEWTYVVQRGHEDGMIHLHAAGRGWTPAHTEALHQKVTSLGVGPRIEAKPVRRIVAWANYLFADTAGELHEHLEVNNPPSSTQPQLAHHSRGFYGIPLVAAKREGWKQHLRQRVTDYERRTGSA